MADGQGTADTAARTGRGVTPVTPVGPGDTGTPDPYRIGQNANALYDYMVSGLDPNFDRFKPYPIFLKRVARFWAETGAVPDLPQQWQWGKELGMPPTIFRTGAGAGGGGANTANVVRAYETAILNRSMSLGMKLTPEEISYIARVAEAQDYSQEQLMNAIVGIADFNQLQSGTLTATVDEVKAMAKSYLVSVSDQTLQDYAKQIATGQATPEGIKSFIKAQSKAMNPWLTQYIDAGIDPSEVLRSSRDLISKSLGVDATTVDFTDNRFLKMATVTDDKGQTRLANNQELIKNIRSDSAWANTSEAKQSTADLALMISKIFGRSSF